MEENKELTDRIVHELTMYFLKSKNREPKNEEDLVSTYLKMRNNIAKEYKEYRDYKCSL